MAVGRATGITPILGFRRETASPTNSAGAAVSRAFAGGRRRHIGDRMILNKFQNSISPQSSFIIAEAGRSVIPPNANQLGGLWFELSDDAARSTTRPEETFSQVCLRARDSIVSTSRRHDLG